MLQAKTIDEVSFGKVFLYQVYDCDGEIEGLLATTAQPEDIEKLEEEWKATYNRLLQQCQSPDPTIYGFVDFLNKRGYLAERVFCERISSLTKKAEDYQDTTILLVEIPERKVGD